MRSSLGAHSWADPLWIPLHNGMDSPVSVLALVQSYWQSPPLDCFGLPLHQFAKVMTDAGAGSEEIFQDDERKWMKMHHTGKDKKCGLLSLEEQGWEKVWLSINTPGKQTSSFRRKQSQEDIAETSSASWDGESWEDPNPAQEVHWFFPLSEEQMGGKKFVNQLDKAQNFITLGSRFYLMVHFITRGLMSLTWAGFHKQQLTQYIPFPPTGTSPGALSVLRTAAEFSAFLPRSCWEAFVMWNPTTTGSKPSPESFWEQSDQKAPLSLASSWSRSQLLGGHRKDQGLPVLVCLS